MALSECRLIKNSMEYVSSSDINRVPGRTRGLYVLYRENKKDNSFNVVYVGMARGKSTGITSRLLSHRRNPRKRNKWTHFSIYEVWDNITEEEIEELEGLFRHLFRKDAMANSLALQRSYKPLNKVARRSKKNWIKRFPT